MFTLNARTARRPVLLVVAAACAALAVGGCKSDTQLTAKDEKVARATAERKGPLNLNDVPPEQRERVRAFMQANQAPPSAATQRR